MVLESGVEDYVEGIKYGGYPNSEGNVQSEPIKRIRIACSYACLLLLLSFCLFLWLSVVYVGTVFFYFCLFVIAF